MKTLSLKALLLISVLCQCLGSYSQTLHINGRFLNTREEPILSTYTLYCNDTIVVEGTKRGIDLELFLNKEYRLIINSDGYRTKTVGFSTFTETVSDYTFEFDAVLHPVPAEEEKTKATGNKEISVLYDPWVSAFDYKVICKY